jgi:RNA polymerase sigma factor (sigma-70 family)
MDGTIDHSVLVRAALDGDDEAFGELVRKFQDWAVGYSFSILGDFGLAEDAAQEAFVEAYVNLENLREPRAFPGWLRRLVHTQCNRATLKKKLPTVGLEDITESPASRPEPTEVVETEETRVTVLGRIADLPEHERAAVTLFYIGEQSHREISEFLDISVPAVKSRLHSARKKLKRSLFNMVKDEIKEQRPSRNDDFSEKVWKGLRGVYVDDTQTSYIDGEAPTL